VAIVGELESPDILANGDWAREAPTLAAATMKMIRKATIATESASVARVSRGFGESMRVTSTVASLP
jgi:hypothetical protein